MAMESVLQQLEERIDTLITTYRSELARAAELESEVAALTAKVEELETRLSSESEAGDRVKALEDQRDELAGRLEKVLGLIDGVLDERD